MPEVGASAGRGVGDRGREATPRRDACRLMEDCLPVIRDEAPRRHPCAALHTTGALHVALGDLDAAEAAFADGLRAAPPNSLHALYPVEGLAVVAAKQGEVKRAVRLAASAAAVRTRAGVPAEPEWQRQVHEAVAEARRHRRAASQNLAAAAAHRLDGDRLVAYALRLSARQPSGSGQGDSEPPLTAREYQIALLVAEGLSNREAAEKLGRSTATVASHLNSIRDKLALRSRTQIALWAVAQLRDGDNPPSDPRQDGDS
ncbi:response regulator transcription factor [Streptomyces sp. NPDC051636]|uniref:response regulator transcription factor n=1 Tax=Streptomyces sp. NPDC051636 TaxID=3365663 RepID=UPI00378A7BFC